MASTDLEQFFKTIRNAPSGEAVRDAIIYAAKAIRTAANNSATLGGVDARLFAVRGDYDTLMTMLYDQLKFDTIEMWDDNDGYLLESQNVMTSGNLYELLQQYFRPAIASVMHYEIDPMTDKETKEAIRLYLENLKQAKEDMYKAILAKTKMHWSNNTFRDFAEIINHIDDDTPSLEAGSFSKNGTYDAGENTTEYKAYESIKVNISDSELKVSGSSSENNTTKYPPEGKLFGSFNVNVPNAREARSSSMSGRVSGTAGEGVDDDGMLDVKEITENGPYVAAEEGLTGYKSVNVKVTEPIVSGTFTVTFVNGADELDVQEVPAYGTAMYSGATPVNNDNPSQEFYGWYPPPVRVTENLTCQALFRDPEINPTAVTGEISDGWETIVLKSSEYKIGEYKSLSIGTVGNTNYGTLIMEKVADWGNGSIWCSKTVLEASKVGGTMTAWAGSNVRKFLNNDFIDILSTTVDGSTIVDNLRPHNIYTMSPFTNWEDASITRTYNHYNTYCEMETYDKIWVPSITELAGLQTELTRKNIEENFATTYTNILYGIEQHGQRFMNVDHTGWKIGYGEDPTYSNRGPALSLVWDMPSLDPPASPLRKTRAVSTGTAQEYTLRTLMNYGHPNASTTLLFTWWHVNAGGTTIGGTITTQALYYPICFSV